MMQVAEFIAKTTLFKGLSPADTQALSGIARRRAFKKGQVIFSEGQEAGGFYVLTRGTVKIYKLSPEGKEQILHFFQAGEPFGEVPVFAGENYPASAEATENSDALFFPRADFLMLIHRAPALALNMLAILSRRLRGFSNLIESLSLKEVPGRLAAYLIYSEGAKDRLLVDLRITKNQLANVLGTAPETLSRILARMTKEGYIVPAGSRRITILDYPGLEELASGERKLTPS